MIGDITFIPTAAGWLYLAVVIDLCSRKIVGWSLADHMRAQLVTDALRQALGSRPGTGETIFHSDRGSQYGSGAYRELLAKSGMRQSMSARANPYHNAWTESFMGTLKTEPLHLLSEFADWNKQSIRVVRLQSVSTSGCRTRGFSHTPPCERRCRTGSGLERVGRLRLRKNQHSCDAVP